MVRVAYTPMAEKYFKKLKDNHLRNAFKDAIMSVRENPEIGVKKTGDLKGICSLDVFYNRINYELAYRIYQDNNGDLVLIIMAGKRENFYKELKRYMKK